MVKLKQQSIYALTAILFFIFLLIIFLTQTSYGGGDSIQHYNMAHWGWKYPWLLFDHWGKPAFTILISPFAQLGINGARSFNLLLGFGTAIIIWKIAQILKFRNSELSMFLVLFTPVYFILMFTPLTEVSFSFFLVLSILLFFKRKYYLSALVLSFLPLIRNEGIVLFPLFILAFSLKRKMLTIPLLTVGFWLISLLGFSYYDDFWWLITKMPYSGDAVDIYGSGSLFHFLNDTRGILGYPIAVLFVAGLIISLINWGKNDKYRLSDTFFFLLLIPGSYIVFISAHSFVWWQGIGNSLGLVRVIGSVTPLAALTALIGFNLIIDFLKDKKKITGKFIFYGTIFWIFALGLTTHRGGFNLSKNQKLTKQATDFLIKNNLDKHKIYYFDPFALFELGIDPYDKIKSNWGVPNAENPSIGIPDSSIIIWDAHFGPNEGRVSLDALQNQKSLELIKIFKPEKPFTVLGGYNYEIYVFIKSSNQSDKLITNLKFNFETDQNGDTTFSHTGNKSRHITSSVVYSNSVVVYLQDILDTISDFSITVNGYLYIEEPLAGVLPLVCTLQNDNENRFYRTFELQDQITKVGEWNYFEHDFSITNARSPEEQLKIYIWNKNKQNFYLDDFAINFEPRTQNPEP